jgi:iron(III) transport system substrate-binding protein
MAVRQRKVDAGIHPALGCASKYGIGLRGLSAMRWLMAIVAWIGLSGTTVLGATLLEQANTEGEVIFYSSLNNVQIKSLTEAFSKKYPAVKARFYRAGSDRVIQRIITEAQAGRHVVDVISAAGFQLQLIKEKGLTAPFHPAAASSYEDGFKDPEGHWISVHSLLNSMAYNTALVSPEAAPRKYEDLLDPKWKGQIGLNIRDVEWYVNMQRRMGREKAREFLKRLSAQKPGMREGHSLLAQLLAAGEFRIVVNSYAHIVARVKGWGAPVQWVFDQPVITYVHPIALAKHAPHPNAGMLFINFVLSREGQSMLRDAGRIPSHRDIDPNIFSLRKIRLSPSDPTLAVDYKPAADEMRTILGVQ